MTTVTLGRLVAEIEGEGAPVVLVHGLGGSTNTFQPQMQVLARYRAVRVDLPGSGRSPVPYEAPSIETFAEAVTAAVRMVVDRPAHFVGHSLGTLVCQHIAARSPELVASLTLFGALLEPGDAAREGLRQRARAARSDGMQPIADQIIAATLSADTKASNPAASAFVRESLMRQDAEGYARTCEALAGAVAADHRRIGAPCLMIAGGDDPVAPPSIAHGLAERISGAKVAVLDRCGHWATIERPADCNRRLADFLGSI
jgi:3-oxoadipate enol-lactonase